MLMQTLNCQNSEGCCKNPETHAANSFTRGFTLVEVLLVLFLISIMTGLVLVTLPGLTLSQDLDKESQRLDYLLSSLRNQALLESMDYGMEVGPDSYTFKHYDDASGKWKVMEEKLFSIKKIPNNIQVSLEVESDDLQYGGTRESDEFGGLSSYASDADGVDAFGDSDGASDEAPPVLILSSGDMTPFSLTLRSRLNEEVKVLTSDGYGDLQWR